MRYVIMQLIFIDLKHGDYHQPGLLYASRTQQVEVNIALVIELN